VDDGEEVADSPFLDWHHVPFRTLLGEQVPHPLFLANDVVGLTKAQQWFGHGRTYPDFALLTVGAGVGYGLVVNDAVVPTQVSPVSHLPVDSGGPLCARGHRGCLTSFVTSGAITAAVATALERAVTFDEVLELARNHHPVATRVVSDAGWAIGRAIAMITSLTGVDRLILSGEGVAIAEIGRTALREAQLAHTVNAEKAPEPVIRHMDFHEWARGAAVLAIQASFP
jgi:predicted NBD/HSP70 family sugar kinase